MYMMIPFILLVYLAHMSISGYYIREYVSYNSMYMNHESYEHIWVHDKFWPSPEMGHFSGMIPKKNRITVRENGEVLRIYPQMKPSLIRNTLR